MSAKVAKPDNRRAAVQCAAEEDPRAIATRSALVDAAERLIGQHGVNAVSMRAVGVEIGSANPAVVGYHFGGRDALVDAVIRDRMAWIEARRQQLLAVLEERGEPADLSALVEALFRPLFDLVDADGRHSYAAFLAGLQRHDSLAGRAGMRADFPVTDALTDGIISALPTAARLVAADRFPLVTQIVTGSLQLIDDRACAPRDAERIFADALRMVEAALAAAPPTRSS